MPELWNEADLISVYNRADAIADGELVDVSKLAKEAGFKFPVAITRALHAKCEPDEAERAIGQDYTGRLWDVLWCAYLAARKATTDRITFSVIFAETDDSAPDGVRHPETTLVSVCGPGDTLEPVITIGFPDDF